MSYLVSKISHNDNFFFLLSFLTMLLLLIPQFQNQLFFSLFINIVEMTCFEIFILHLISLFINGGSFSSTIMTVLLAKFEKYWIVCHSVYIYIYIYVYIYTYIYMYIYTEWHTIQYFSNFARSTVIIVEEKDPPLINKEIKCKIKISKQVISTIFIKREKNNWFWNCGIRSSSMVRNDKRKKKLSLWLIFETK